MAFNTRVCLSVLRDWCPATPGCVCLCRVVAALNHIQAHNPISEIVVMAILPRGSDWTSFRLPSDYSRGIQILNNLLEEHTSKQDKLHFADCSKAFLSQDGQVSCFNLCWAELNYNMTRREGRGPH